jgi:hypothetical protein
MKNATFHMHGALVALSVIVAITALSIERFGWLASMNPVLSTLGMTAWAPFLTGLYSYRFPRNMFIAADGGAQSPAAWAYGHWLILGGCGIWVFLELLLNPAEPRLFGLIIVMIGLGMNVGDYYRHRRHDD